MTELTKRLTVRFTLAQWRHLTYLGRAMRRSRGGVVRLLLDAAVPTGHREVEVDTRKWDRRLNIMEAEQNEGAP